MDISESSIITKTYGAVEIMLITLNTNIRKVYVCEGTSDEEIYKQLKHAWRKYEGLRQYQFPLDVLPSIDLLNPVASIYWRHGWRVKYI